MLVVRFSSIRIIFIIFICYFALALFFMLAIEKHYENGKEIDSEDLNYFHDILRRWRISKVKREVDDVTVLNEFLSQLQNHVWRTWEISYLLKQLKKLSWEQKYDNIGKDEIPANVKTMTNKTHLSGEVKRPIQKEEEIIWSEADIPTLPEAVYDPQPPEFPGEFGAPINLDRGSLPPTEQQKWDHGYEKYGYNSYVSDQVSVHRRLPDVKPKGCQREFRADLPQTSIITCFHNEAWSVLLRLVHSILNNSPEHLIKEIILFDDYSDMEHLGKPLECYMSKLKKVRILRAKKRVGSIRARSLAMTEARGPVLTVLDSHCECFPGWLEPLLDRVAADRTLIISPTINVIFKDTFAVDGSRLWDLGGFDLERIEFTWLPLNYTEENRNHPDYEPFKSPMLGGGLMSMWKDFFIKTGKYDEQMEIWGPDNVELSLRTWMCGGRMEIHPCSHVGHVFRPSSPFSWGGDIGKILLKNHVRVAEVWLDEYKRFYYGRIGYSLGDYGDISDRRKLRKDLMCNSFQWYIDNVYPELKIPPGSVVEGEFQIDWQGQILCLDAKDFYSRGLPAAATKCHGQLGLQFVRLTEEADIRLLDGCLDYVEASGSVVVNFCAGKKGTKSQKWYYKNDHLVHEETGHCLTIKNLSDKENLILRECSDEPDQSWRIVPAKRKTY